MLVVVMQPVFKADAASLALDKTPTALTEGATTSNPQFNLILSPEPTSEVLTDFTTNGQCSLGPANKDFKIGGSVYTKNPKLHFGVKANDDTIYEGSHTCVLQFSSSSLTDPNYQVAVTKNLTISITDNDVLTDPGYDVVSDNTEMREGGSTVAQYEIRPRIAPQDSIIITASADDQCDLLADASNPQSRVSQLERTIRGGTTKGVSFTLLPREDSQFEGKHQCVVLHSASTDDLTYNGLTTPVYTASIMDNDDNPNIPDQREYEGGLIYYKDANYDGIEDTKQPQVRSFINALNQKRQALLVVNESGELHPDCSFKGDVQSVPFDDQTQSSHISTVVGGLSASVTCKNADTTSYRLLWLLDSYYESALRWKMYQFDTADNLSDVPVRHIIHNLGQDYTSGLLITPEHAGTIRLLQHQPPADTAALGGEEESDSQAAASITDRTGVIVMGGLITVCVAVIGFILYRKYLRPLAPEATTAPDIDRY